MGKLMALGLAFVMFISMIHCSYQTAFADSFINTEILEEYSQLIQGEWVDAIEWNTHRFDELYGEIYSPEIITITKEEGSLRAVIHLQYAELVLVSSLDSIVYLLSLKSHAVYKLLFSSDGKYMVMLLESDPENSVILKRVVYVESPYCHEKKDSDDLELHIYMNHPEYSHWLENIE